MRNPRRSTAAVLLVAAAMLPALAAAPAHAAGPSSVAVRAAADWTYWATYPDLASCEAAGYASGVDWECCPCSQLGYDLYLFF